MKDMYIWRSVSYTLNYLWCDSWFLNNISVLLFEFFWPKEKVKLKGVDGKALSGIDVEKYNIKK